MGLPCGDDSGVPQETVIHLDDGLCPLTQKPHQDRCGTWQTSCPSSISNFRSLSSTSRDSSISTCFASFLGHHCFPSPKDLQCHRLPMVKIDMIDPHWRRVDASSPVDPALRTASFVRSPTVGSRVMDLISSSAHTARREDGFLEFFWDRRLNTTTNSILELHPQTNHSHNSILLVG